MDGILEGANVQEVAEPDVTDNQVEETAIESNGGEAEIPESVTAEQKEKQEQSAELNTQFAAARRKAEEEAKQHREGINAEFRRLFGNITNPVTGKLINGYEDYLQAVEYQQRAAQNKALKEKGINPEMIEQMVQNSPAIRQAQKILEENNKAEAQRRLEDDLKAVSQIAPDIKSLDDLTNHASYKSVLGYVQKGLSLPDAFKLANFDTLSAKSAGAARQAAINQAKSKSHMETTSGLAGASDTLIPIPDSVLGMWKQSYPELTMEQLTKKYNSVM